MQFPDPASVVGPWGPWPPAYHAAVPGAGPSMPWPPSQPLALPYMAAPSLPGGYMAQPGLHGAPGPFVPAPAPAPAPHSASAAQGLPQQTAHQRIELAQRWLLFMRHCATCKANGPNECEHGSRCRSGKNLWNHMVQCQADGGCKYPKCDMVKAILKHHKNCKSVTCPVCVPVKRYVHRSHDAMRAQAQVQANAASQQTVNQQAAQQGQEQGMGMSQSMSQSMQAQSMAMSQSMQAMGNAMLKAGVSAAASSPRPAASHVSHAAAHGNHGGPAAAQQQWAPPAVA